MPASLFASLSLFACCALGLCPQSESHFPGLGRWRRPALDMWTCLYATGSQVQAVVKILFLDFCNKATPFAKGMN